MTFEEYRKYDALGLAGLIKNKSVKAEELVALAIERAEAVNPSINAIVYPMYDNAKKMAKAANPDSVFGGQAFVVKDLGHEIRGTPRTSGSKGYQGYISRADNFLVQQFRKAGLSFLGKTNTSEFGLAPFTEPELFGPSRNPWQQAYTPGGSSGGSGAAVAAGICPLGSASDGGGSIRIPASCCGLVGLKPSRSLLSLGPQSGEGWQGAIVEGCVSKSARDTAAFLDAVRGSMPGEGYLPYRPAPPFLQQIKTPPKPLKIAWSTQNPLGLNVEEDCIQATLHTANLLEQLGHHVEEVPLPYRREDITEVFVQMVIGEAGAELMEMASFLGRKVSLRDVELPTYILHMLSQSFSAGDFAYQKRRWNEICRRTGQFHEQYDILLTPTLAMAPFKIGQLQLSPTEKNVLKLAATLNLRSALKSQIEELADKIFAFIPFTPYANMSGQPSISLPLYWNTAGLPIGSMFTAAIGQDGLLLQLAAQLEEAQDWKQKQPEL
jgi:amidase